MDPIEFRIKNLPPEAPNAMWRRYLREGATEFGWSKRHPTGDPTPGPIKTGMGVAINTWGGGGRGPSQAHCEIASDGSVVVRVGTQDIGTGTRTIVAMVAAETLGLADERRSRRRSATRMYAVSGGSGGSTTAASDQPGDPHRRAQGARGAEGEGRAGARRRTRLRSSPPAAASRSRTRRRRACRGRTRASCSAPQPISVDGNWEPGMSSATTSGVQFAEVEGRHRDRHRQGDARARDPGLRARREPADRREPGLRRRHRLAELRALRGPHPRSQHRADGQSRTWSGTCSPACPTFRRSTCG